MSESTTLALAREALRVVQVDPQQSVRIASTAVRTAREQGDLDAASVAERALGLAAVHLHDLNAATRHLRSAIALAQRGAARELAAEARMTFAYALNLSGRAERALTEIGTALQDLGSLGRARAVAQRAAILQQLGRLDQALADYQAALPVLRRYHDLVWVQRVLSNRGVLYAFRHAYGPAARDMHEAEQLCAELGLVLPAAFVHENLLLVHRRLGDVPTALEHLAAAERIYQSLGAPYASLLVERSELLLSVGLISEAREAAEEAVNEFTRHGRQLGISEARLLLARTAVLDGDPDRAVREARRAVRELTRQGRAFWVTLAESALVLARLEADGSKVSFAELCDAAARAESAGWSPTALDLRLLAGQRGLSGRNRVAARGQLELVSAVRHHGIATRRVKAWYATALLRQDTGDERGADAAAARGLQILDEYRNTMAATDLRARVSGLGVGLAQIGLRNALASRSPRKVLRWAERGRARHLVARPALPPADPELTGLMAQLRAVVAEQLERRSAGRSVGNLLRHQEKLERDIRDLSRRGAAPGPAPGPAGPDQDRLAEALGPVALVEYVELDDLLYAVCITDGRVVLRDLGPLSAVRDQVRWLPFALHRLSHHGTGTASGAAALALLRRVGNELDSILVRPLHDVLGSRPLVLVPTSVVQSMPWSLLPSVAGRPVTVAPAAALWAAAAGRTAQAGRAVVVAGPGLTGAQQEAERVAEVYGVQPLVGDAATVENVTSALSDASLLHLGAHGMVRADNPLFSSLRLADGPLTVYDLERLDHGVDTVVLAACESGRDVVLASDELLGLSAAFLARDTRNVVASVVPIPDAATTGLMTALHERAARGMPVASALAEAQQAVDPADASAYAAAVGFVCVGAGFTAVATGTDHLSRSAPRLASET